MVGKETTGNGVREIGLRRTYMRVMEFDVSGNLERFMAIVNHVITAASIPESVDSALVITPDRDVCGANIHLSE